MSDDLAPLTCWLCDRPMGDIVQWDHPVPKAKKGKIKVPVHPICHKTIHANFTNNELARIGDGLSAGHGAANPIPRCLHGHSLRPAHRLRHVESVFFRSGCPLPAAVRLRRQGHA